MILSTDISNHFEMISKYLIFDLYFIIVAFKGRLSSKKFPDDTNEDKQIIMNMCIYAADHANPCKSSLLYFRWMALEMEEYY